MPLRIDEFAMRSIGKEGGAKFTADLAAREPLKSQKPSALRAMPLAAADGTFASDEKAADLDWKFSVDAPESLVDLAEIILHGARPDMRSLSLKSLMEPSQEKGVWHYRAERSGAAAP